MSLEYKCKRKGIWYKQNRLPSLESLDYCYNTDYPAVTSYTLQYSWMDTNTIGIRAYMGNIENCEEKVLEINIQYKHKNLYGRPYCYNDNKRCC